ncbi:MAG: deoxyhypusine synthase [Deltaproteobacteria bacterium]|nr:deoxyhypusine synthase [Deltaproteobacteria bacterium]
MFCPKNKEKFIFDFKKRKKLVQDEVKPVEIKPNSSVDDLIRRMGDTAFQGKNLSLAVDVWEDMLRDKKSLVFFGLAGAMVPAGMREVLVHLLKHRYIDCLVSTGANLFHDIHETLGWSHWKGSHMADDNELREAGVDRMYDVYAFEEEFNTTDEYIYNFAKSLDVRPYTTREFFSLMGKDLSKRKKKEGIVSAAYKYGVPIYSPAVADSSIGIALALMDGKDNFIFDLIGDVKETAHLASKAGTSGVIFVGGGTPKNFIQQSEVTASMMCKRSPGHKYALQITADSPHWGGLSGCTFEEAQSWGKIAKKSKRVTVNSDTTIALPLIVSALTERLARFKRKPPSMDLEGSWKVKKRLWD